MSNVPEWWNGPESSWGATAEKATGMTTYDKVPVLNREGKVVRYKWQFKLTPVPEQYKNLSIPWPNVGHPLPHGAFESLFPDSFGWTWVQKKPDGWGPGWLPKGNPKKTGG
jgi:hypothetical protein